MPIADRMLSYPLAGVQVNVTLVELLTLASDTLFKVTRAVGHARAALLDGMTRYGVPHDLADQVLVGPTADQVSLRSIHLDELCHMHRMLAG